MLKHISKLILKKAGWKVLPFLPTESKCIILSAPHTSMWDFFWARLYFWAVSGQGKVLVKEELFVFPLGWLLKRMGALPISRSRKSNQVNQISLHFQGTSHLHLGIAPEGTRKPVERWKRGFYHIAKATGVPVFLHKTDYAEKIIGIFARFEVTDDIESDMKRLRSCYANVTARFPENFRIGNVQPFDKSDSPIGVFPL